MASVQDPLGAFSHAAEKLLREHKAELRTKYQGRDIPTNQETRAAIKIHKEILRSELEEQVLKFSVGADSNTKAELGKQPDIYLEKFEMANRLV